MQDTSYYVLEIKGQSFNSKMKFLNLFNFKYLAHL